MGIVVAGAGIAIANVPQNWRLAAVSWLNPVQASPPAPATSGIAVSTFARALIDAAERQIGVTVTYDGAYQGMDYPGGDIDISRGVCTDVIIRALRDGHDLDLQKLVHEDMRAAFSTYPTNWGLSSTDRNIDHRRVPNLQAYFNRAGYDLPITDSPTDYLPGDLVTWMLPRNLPHIGIVTDRTSPDGKRPIIVHNVGAGARLNDFLFAYPITGHYRLNTDS